VFTPREDETGRYYEITGAGTITPVLAGIVDTKAWCPRRATSLAHFWLACTSSSKRTRLFGFDLAADGV
jgi:hypothetical protein